MRRFIGISAHATLSLLSARYLPLPDVPEKAAILAQP